jgi:hypothetical protein
MNTTPLISIAATTYSSELETPPYSLFCPGGKDATSSKRN